MEEDYENEYHVNCIHKGVRKQDYAQILFNLARAEDGEFTCVIERAWAMDVSSYIIELENEVRKIYLAQQTQTKI